MHFFKQIHYIFSVVILCEVRFSSSYVQSTSLIVAECHCEAGGASEDPGFQHHHSG
jgi:hypothetical protein